MTYHFYGFFFFKQKTAYEMRISDWSSDVCSSDLSCTFSLCAVRFMHQPDENILERALPCMQILERYADVGHPPQQRGHPGRLGLAVEFIHELMPSAGELKLPVGKFGGHDLQLFGPIERQGTEEKTSEPQYLIVISYANL